MKVIAIEVARAAQLFVPDEVKPRKGMYFPELAHNIKSRYEFVLAPDPTMKIEGGAKFASGRLSRNGETINIGELTLWNDAIVVEASTTEAANAVLDDFFPWLAIELDFGNIPTKLPRSYVSGVVVQFAQTIDHAISKFSEFKNLLTEAYNESYSYIPLISLDKLSFGQDVGTTPKSVISREFIIERRVGTVQADNRFYTASAFPTEKHIHLIEQFESLLIQSKL